MKNIEDYGIAYVPTKDKNEEKVSCGLVSMTLILIMFLITLFII